MTFYRCTCGQPLASFVTDVAGLPFAVPHDRIRREVDAQLARHLAGLPGGDSRHHVLQAA